MTTSRYILQSKMSFLGASKTITRQKLLSLFTQFLSHPLITVVAGAGYGKSTTIAQAAQYLGATAVWVRVDQNDSDFITFFSYLIASVKTQFPLFDDRIMQQISENILDEDKAESIMGRLVKVLEQIPPIDTLIVLDDCHTVFNSRMIRRALIYLIQNMPPHIHLVTAARSEPPWPLALFRARRQVLDIRESELSLSCTETTHFYRDIFNFNPNQKVIATIHAKTGGWISGLILFYHALKDKQPDEVIHIAEKVNGSHDLIASYLEENIYQQQPREMKSFLTKAALLSPIHVDLCDRLTHTTSSARKFRQLEDNHLFTFPVDASRREYYFHHLFQDFLQMKAAQTIGRAKIMGLNHEIASFHENRGDTEIALDYYLKAKQWPSAARVLKDIGRKMLIEGRLSRFIACYNSLPARTVESEVMLQYLYAHTLVLSNNRPKAVREFRKVLNKSRKTGEFNVELLTLKELAVQQAQNGNFKGAADRLKEQLQKAGRRWKELSQKENYLISQMYLIIFLSFLGKIKAARRFYKLIVEVAEEIEEDYHKKSAQIGQELCATFIEFFSGQGRMALEMGEKLIERANALDIALQKVYPYQLMAMIYIDQNQYAKALEIAHAGLDLKQQFGIKIEYLAWFDYFAGCSYLELEQQSQGLRHLDKALKKFQTATNHYGQAHCFLVYYYTFQRSGDTQKAINYLNLGYKSILKCTVPSVKTTILCELALVALEKKEFESAAAYFREARQLAKPLKKRLSMVICLQSKYDWLKGRKTPALNKLETHLTVLADNYEDHLELFQRFGWIVPLLVTLYAKRRTTGFLQIIFAMPIYNLQNELMRLKRSARKEIRQAADVILSQRLKKQAPKLSIYFLKEFRLFIGDSEVEDQHWKNKKALRLFKYFILSIGKGFIPKEILMEFLWPEEDPEKTVNRLHVTLNTLRKILEPGLIRSTDSVYLQRRKDAYKICDSKIKFIDVNEFLNELDRAGSCADSTEAMVHYERAAALYVGDLLESEPYEEWCFELKTKLKNDFGRLTKPILDYYEAREDYATCIRYAERFIAVDKYAEDIYQRLMTYYHAVGSQKMVHATFIKCRDSVAKELDVPLAHKTVALHQTLTSHSSNSL